MPKISSLVCEGIEWYLEEKVDEILFWCKEVDQKLYNKKDK